MRETRSFTDEVCRPFFLEGGPCGVLLLHGFTGSAAHMRPLGEALHSRGFTVMGINLPGHALSMEAMAETGWQDWLDAAKEAFRLLQQRCTMASVAGLSMGGCLALLIAQQMQPAAAAVISAPMAVRNPLLPLAGMMAPFVPKVMWRDRGASAALLDRRYDYGYPGFPTRCGADLHRIIGMARRDLHAVQCPLLIVQSRADETISTNSAQIISDGVSSERAGILWLQDAPHVCTLSPDVEKIADAMAELFRCEE